MKVTPIIFSGAMVRALIDGRKTQTRRVIKPQPRRVFTQDFYQHEWKPPGVYLVVGKAVPNGIAVYTRTSDGSLGMSPCPYGVPGDLLWVKETHTFIENDKGNDTLQFRADFPESDWKVFGPWTPSIFMPRRLSRLTLRITDVRVQRVQEISEDDVIEEGLTHGDYLTEEERVCVFGCVWDSINAKKHPWESNPWVWALTIEVIQANVDAVLKEAA